MNSINMIMNVFSMINISLTRAEWLVSDFDIVHLQKKSSDLSQMKLKIKCV